MAKVKVCGITKKEDALKAIKHGATAIGFIFYKKSPRYISPYKARKIIAELPPFVTPVGVFVNEKAGKLADIVKVTGIHTVQLHGDETYHYCHRLHRSKLKVIKAFCVSDSFHVDAILDYNVDAYLFDTYSKDEYGGTGESFDWKLLKGIKTKTKKPIIISGGLNSTNVIEVVNGLKPYAVDVNSGVEKAPGQKDPRLLQDFLDVVNYISGPNVKTHD